MRKSLILAALAVFSQIGTACAAEADEPIQIPRGLEAPLRAGFEVHKNFMAVPGLTGWILEAPDGQYHVFYTTADGQYMITGALVSPSGENLTERHAEMHIPKLDLGKLWEKLEQSNYVVSGAKQNPKSVIYVFMDVNCIFCHYLWLALQPYEEAGLQVRWIPVAILREDSASKAAAVFVGGEEALDAFERKYGEPDAPNGITVTPELREKIDANLRLMREARVNGTPGIFYKDASGTVQRRDGMPSLSLLPEITGLPRVDATDPKLDRFK